MLACAALSSAPARAQDIPVPPGMRKEVITDPSLGMDAYDVFVPTKWHFQGTIIQGTTCMPTPYPVFKISSPDGLQVVERLPRMDWSWKNQPGVGPALPQGNCLPLTKPLSAEEFAKYIAATLNVEYVSDQPLPQAFTDELNKNLAASQAMWDAKYRAAGMVAPKYTSSHTNSIVRFKNGSFVIKGQLSTAVDCQLAPPTARMGTSSCNATVRYARAPEDQFAAFIPALNPAGAVMLQPWNQAWLNRNTQQTAANIRQIQANGAAARAQTVASAQQFQQSQDLRQHMHEQFMATMQRGTDQSLARSAQIANTNHTIAQDWADYALDRQTVRDPNSGQVSKVSSASSYTWVDETGKTSYQTNDVNADPNGTLRGTWTRQQVVHGDGSP
jgi:hypothetical protein